MANSILLAALCTGPAALLPVQAGEGAGAVAGSLEMTAAKRQAQGIRTAIVAPHVLAGIIMAPGEVRINTYASSQVTPRISAQVVARHARLGDEVTKDQPLVTLSSVAMAEAQGALVEADREWNRVRKLGRKVVSEKRYVAAQVARQRAYATVRAYGMTGVQIKRLLAEGDAARATGGFDLPSPQAGTIIHDDFVVGELIEPGKVLFEISDESVLWVEAMLNPEDAARIVIGAPARVSVDGVQWLDGKVIQRHHRLDETTRTRSIRIEVDNSTDRLHPGQFVQAAVQSSTAAAVMAVPREAIVLFQGSPSVFRVEGDALNPQPIETGVTRVGYTEVKAGLTDGDEVVVQGAFLIKSLLLKSQIGDEH
ncbi:MAG: efflux RND transporter periplasmic adaptor subunit [Thiogranum sp.]